MQVVRLISPEQVILMWDVFREGLESIVRLTGERMSDSDYCKMLVNMSARDDAWVGVVVDGGPLSYGVAVDSTPPHSHRKTFTILSFYAIPGRPEVTEYLMHAFEAWARETGVRSYVVTTRRDSGAAMKCFGSTRYGFRRSYTAFEKTL